MDSNKKFYGDSKVQRIVKETPEIKELKEFVKNDPEGARALRGVITLILEHEENVKHLEQEYQDAVSYYEDKLNGYELN
jgi:hypothetical protein